MLWRFEHQEGRTKPWTKAPYSVTGARASVTDPATWSSFSSALAVVQAGQADGLGIVLTRDDDLVGIDLDSCRDAATGQLEEKARKWAVSIGSYVEVSPSGTGIRVFVRGQLPVDGKRKSRLEVYAARRYLTLTGHPLEGAPATIERRQEILDRLYAKMAGPAPQNGQRSSGMSPGRPDHEVLAAATKARNGAKVIALLRGDTSAYSSHSEADLALLSGLAFYTQDAGQLERLWRGSGLWRPKAERVDYRQQTITKAVANVTQTWDPGGDGRPDAEDVEDREDALPASSSQWPAPLDEAAYHGLAGEVVRAIDPHTEADPAAILVQFLTGYGSLIGRHAYFVAEADRHHTNLFTVLVGETAKGRKGTSWGRIRRLLEKVDQEWADTRIVGGLSSGEGLIYEVRDPVEKLNKQGELEIVDEGVEDKRLLVFQAEFSTVLKQAGRERNILADVVREAWDLGHLRNMVVQNPRRASDAHISIVGHITRDELLRQITETEAANGFANRILWVCVRRSKILPDGGGQPELSDLVGWLRESVEFAAGVHEVRRDEEARAIWHQVYEALSEGRPGLLGSMIARSEAQVMRLAVIYAMLDCSPVISAAHLTAALALWQFAEDSARYIFGQKLGDPTADAILSALKAAPDGLTRKQLYVDVFSRNKQSDEIARALHRLLDQRLVRSETVQTGGRPAETWSAT